MAPSNAVGGAARDGNGTSQTYGGKRERTGKRQYQRRKGRKIMGIQVAMDTGFLTVLSFCAPSFKSDQYLVGIIVCET